jgi:predicted nuclease of predicted toxin-antitoxin system
MLPVRFLVDACVDVRLAHWLRERGYDARHLRDEGLSSLPNGRIFSKAIAEGRVVVTHDLDFGEISALTHGQTASVIVFRLHNPRLPRLIERLSAVLADCLPALQAGAVVIVEEARHRVRNLPIGLER